MNFSWIAKLNKLLEKKKKKNSNNIVWFYPEHALQKAISNSTVKTVILLEARSVVHSQGQGQLLVLQKAPKHQ